MSRRIRALLIVAVAVAVIVPVVAIASDRFTDVPGTNIFHDDIGWLADAGVTLGCNPPLNNRFCPEDNVTRQQMAAFMRRLAQNKVVDAKTAITADSISSGAAITRCPLPPPPPTYFRRMRWPGCSFQISAQCRLASACSSGIATSSIFFA